MHAPVTSTATAHTPSRNSHLLQASFQCCNELRAGAPTCNRSLHLTLLFALSMHETDDHESYLPKAALFDVPDRVQGLCLSFRCRFHQRQSSSARSEEGFNHKVSATGAAYIRNDGLETIQPFQVGLSNRRNACPANDIVVIQVQFLDNRPSEVLVVAATDLFVWRHSNEHLYFGDPLSILLCIIERSCLSSAGNCIFSADESRYRIGMQKLGALR